MKKTILVILALLTMPSLSLADIPQATEADIRNYFERAKNTHCDSFQRTNWDNECQRAAMHKIMSVEIADLYEQKFYQLQAAIRDRDVEATSKLIAYPLEFHYVQEGTKPEAWPRKYHTKFIDTPKQFSENYDYIFNELFSESILHREFSDLLTYNLSSSFIAPYSMLSMDLFCSDKKANWKINPKKNCKDPDVRITYINNDETIEWWKD